MSRTSALLASAALRALAACGDSSNRIAGPSAPEPSLEIGYANAHLHIMPLKSQAQEAHARKQGGGGGGTGIFYHGGPVLQSGTNVAAVYWAASTIYSGGPAPGASGSGAQDGSLVGLFLRNLGGSPYFNINHSYTDGSGAAIANAVSYTQYWAN